VSEAGSKVVLITGASSGIGSACAEHLAGQGHRVYGGSRSGKGTSGSWIPIAMDVTDEGSVESAVHRVDAEAGRLDVVVNNAGFGIAGAVEETSVEEARRQFETNFFGVLRVCRAALPLLRRRGGGLVVNISSIGGLLGLPFEGLYSASKFALEGLSEALSLEVRPFGIRVVLIEPGDIRTSFPANRVWTDESRDDSPYRESRLKVRSSFERDEASAPGPEGVARLVGRILRCTSPAPRYTAGPLFQRVAIPLRRFLPGRLFAWVVRRAYGL
jgi:NAD(P)-dependent dehydrogenase (short-subunit alcohol dehydrogenase family)